ncbi:thiamine-phosphate pyrophosphorylase [Flavobacterium endophyticum]|uniref:Thiamine-phosphate synthase n=1 Tax=Flavobacterium endophyticum TaxID=1540163 RepID=A0A495ML43_9FLAO|nr:thiamine phosphate synthase [Flavobacterium endophyticum]RKS25039.1 thiamine-phosphate pyrophosphorylase [Flavobacterium endophyticum]
MRRRSFPYLLYLVLSEADCLEKNYLHVAEQAIIGGVDIIQLREKDLTAKEYIAKAQRLKEITDRYAIPLIINDNLEVAKKIGAFGIHVGNNDVPPTHIRKEWKSCQSLGYSIEFIEQLQSKETEAADCLGISPVFHTPTKKDTVTTWGIEGIAALRKLTDKPLIAIGGMNAANAEAALKAGADCIAVVSAICAAADPQKAAYELKNILLRNL